MIIPKLTQKQLIYLVIALLLFVVIWFAARDIQSQQALNKQVKVCYNNLDWLANKCDCNLEQIIEQDRNERLTQAINNAWTITQQNT